VTIVVSGTYIVTEQTLDYGDYDGPCAVHYAGIRRTGGFAVRFATPPGRFARALARILDERRPFARHAVGLDALPLMLGIRPLSGRLLHRIICRVMGLARHGALRVIRDSEAGSTRRSPTHNENP